MDKLLIFVDKQILYNIKMKNLVFITYNTLFNRGLNGVKELINQYQPDIICLQEIETSEINLSQLESKKIKIANYSNYSLKKEGIFGMATFYNKEKFKLRQSKIIPLKKTFLDFIVSLPNFFKKNKLNRNFLKSEFIFLNNRKKIIIYNTHLTVYGSNKAKINQLKLILEETKKIKNTPIIIAGDFNYFPYNRKKLEKMMSDFGFNEATSSINYTIEFRNLKHFYYNFIARIITKIFSFFYSNKLKIDYVFYKNLKLLKSSRIDVDYSDHYPIMIEFTF